MNRIILLFSFCIFSFTTVLAQTQENWSRFRGPNGQGISKETNLPVQWSAKENIVWKTDMPGEDWSSPIVRQPILHEGHSPMISSFSVPITGSGVLGSRFFLSLHNF